MVPSTFCSTPQARAPHDPLEAFDKDSIRRQLDTNVIGLLETFKAVRPHMGAAKSGTIVNVRSIGSKMPSPLDTLQYRTKFAVEDIRQALHHEIEPLVIRMKIVEPGMIRTGFGGDSFDFAHSKDLPDDDSVHGSVPACAQLGSDDAGSDPDLAAMVIWTAATDSTPALRCTAGADAKTFSAVRNAQDDATFIEGLEVQPGLT